MLTIFIHYTYGNFILMNTRSIKNERRILPMPVINSNILFSLGVRGLLVWSRMMKPIPPRAKRKLEARPSIIY